MNDPTDEGPTAEDMRAIFARSGDEPGPHEPRRMGASPVCIVCGKEHGQQQPRSAYAEALSQAADDLEDALACIRAETTAGRVSPAEAAAERADLLQRHLARLEQLRREHLGGEG